MGCDRSAAVGRFRVYPETNNLRPTKSSRSLLSPMLAINTARRAPTVFRTAAPLSTWSAVPAGPPDAILGRYDPPL